MAENSKIEWTDHTFNPWIGCTKVHAGCEHCYAESLMDSRYGKVKWGPSGSRVLTSPANWRKPVQWNKAAAEAGRPALVFCASLADIFEAWGDKPVLDHKGLTLIGPDGLQRRTLADVRRRLFDLIDATPHLIWLMLTKRPGLVRAMWPDGKPRSNVWLGTSPCDQETADKAIPALLGVRDLCGGTFLSCEPLIGEVRLDRISIHHGDPYDGRDWHVTYDNVLTGFRAHKQGGWDDPKWKIDWVIVGGESGHEARPVHPAWVRSLRDQCAKAGTPLFFKQWGEYGTRSENISTGEPVFREFTSFQHWVAKAPTWVNGGTCVDVRGRVLTSGKGFQNASTECTFPVAILHRLGKKKAGRWLDGREWSQFPEAFQREAVDAGFVL